MLIYQTVHYITLHHTTLDHTATTTIATTTKIYSTPDYATHSLQHNKRNFNYTTLSTLHHNHNSTTLHPAVVGEVTDQVTTETIVTTPKNTTLTTFQSISGFALPSVIQNNQALL